MSETTLDVGYYKGTLPIYANAGRLTFNDDGVTYNEKVGDKSWSWPWDGIRVWFQPPGSSGKGNALFAFGVLGLLLPSRSQRWIQVLSGDDDAIFELPSRNPRPLIVAQRIVDTVPAAAGHISFNEQVLG